MKPSQVDQANADDRAGYADTLNQITSGGFCPFCPDYLFKHHTKPVIFKNAHWLVTENAWPYDGAEHHLVLIARRHVENATALSTDAWKALGSAYKKVVKAYELKGATLLMRSGDTSRTGASVRHLHAQIIASGLRKKNGEKIMAVVGFKKK